MFVQIINCGIEGKLGIIDSWDICDGVPRLDEVVVVNNNRYLVQNVEWHGRLYVNVLVKTIYS